MKIIDKIALALVIIGAINWGLIGIFNFNLVDTIFGTMSIISRIIYILVGVSGLWCIKALFTFYSSPLPSGNAFGTSTTTLIFII